MMEIYKELKKYRESEDPADRKFYLWGITELLILARIFYKFKKSEELKTIGKGLREIKDNYRIYPLVKRDEEVKDLSQQNLC